MWARVSSLLWPQGHAWLLWGKNLLLNLIKAWFRMALVALSSALVLLRVILTIIGSLFRTELSLLTGVHLLFLKDLGGHTFRLTDSQPPITRRLTSFSSVFYSPISMPEFVIPRITQYLVSRLSHFSISVHPMAFVAQLNRIQYWISLGLAYSGLSFTSPVMS